ncbi:outer dynein arm-docking complex subunit 4-like [Venturia canescens]|uniref:outer dynein arm-docking complex subunit 4-like n=1 Tax=Venturia canescens TaxID=32260 RepID=UPI001C9BFD18|nr:outer dynein arm-docking complex subunit 4-like [Venturia canescens]
MVANKESDPPAFRSPNLYREWGFHAKKIENYDVAIGVFEKSIRESSTDDLRTLVGLFEALTNSTRYQEAADVALKCTKIDPDNVQVKCMWVEALFNLAEFGQSLIHAHRGSRKTKLPFERAIKQANETIEDCVGLNTSPDALVLLYPWIKKLEEYRRSLVAKLNEEEDEFEGIDEDHSKFKVNDPAYKLEVHLKKLDRLKAKQYLGTLAEDKFFLEQVLENPALESANKEGSEELLKLVEECVRCTRYRQEVLRVQKPLYTFAFERERQPGDAKARRLAEKRMSRNQVVIDANMYLQRLHEARVAREYAAFFSLLERAKDSFDAWEEDIFPMKKPCLDALYEMISWVYLDPRDVSTLSDPSTKATHLKHHLGVRVAVVPRDAELGWVATENGSSALEVFRKRLALASQPLELAWLFHDLAKYYIEIKRYDLARLYAKKSRDSGYKARHDPWTLNAHHLMIRIEIHQHNRNEAREAAVLAYLGAKRLRISYLQDFYRRIVKLVNDIDLSTIMGIDSITERENLIIELMPDELKTEATFLFARMRAVPAKRRLSVMPGCKPVDTKSKVIAKRKTILPSSPKNPETEARRALLKRYAPSKKIPGWVDFDDYA